MISLRKALEKTMVLPDIYKPVCNSERLPIRHKYRSCKGIRNVPVGKKVDKYKPVGDGLGMMKTQMINEEGGGVGWKLLSRVKRKNADERSKITGQNPATLQQSPQ